jgi:uncharacterized protein (TIRG00374 family)
MVNADMSWVFVSILASLVAFVSRAIRWNMLIEPLGYKPSVANTTASLLVGYLANLAIPRLGEISRCAMLNRSDKIPLDPLIGTVIIERIIDVICLLACLLIVAATEFNRLGNFLTQNILDPATKKLQATLNSPLIIVTMAAALALLIILLVRKKNNTGKIASRITALLKGVVNGINSVRKLKSPFFFVFHSVLIWYMYFLMSYTCFNALEATAGLSWHAGLFMLVAGGMGMSAPVQGGIGAYHLLVSQGLVLYGLSVEHGLSYATLMHTSQLLTVIVLGGISFLFLSLKRRNENARLT